MVGPGKPVDTNRFFVICPNVVGGCNGTTGPGLDPIPDRPALGLELPLITIRDMVRAQAMLHRRARHRKLLCVQSAVRWAACRCCNGQLPIRSACSAALPIATPPAHSSQNIAFHEVGRQAIMADPDWRGGRYSQRGHQPCARASPSRAWPRTYISDEGLHRKFGRNLQDRDRPTFGFDADFQVELDLRHQGLSFVERFDANSDLLMSRARWIISTSPPTMAGASPMPFSARIRDSASLPSRRTGRSLPPKAEPWCAL